MKEIYAIILNLKYFCSCNENRISSSCHISSAELRSINAIERHKSITCSELAEKIRLSPSRISRITDNLAKKGYLSRQVKDYDRRTTLLYLTKKGEKMKDEINREQKNFERLLTSKLSTQEIESIKIGLKKLENILVNNTKRS
jgi:DNA-binding MarR family transcriptional regulator